MDPTKSFDHLDPKLKETYARVMGTSTGGTTNAGQPAPLDQTLSSSPSVFNPPPAADQKQSTPLDPALSSSPNGGPNPGTGPTVGAVPTEATQTFAPPTPNLPTAPEPAPVANTPNASPFFSNPSPAATEPPLTNGPVVAPTSEPAPTPVTPYSPDNAAGAQASVPSEQYAQPLPSPSSVAQTGPHQASALLKVLYIIGAVVFFAIYTVFWIKVFNLPFLF